MEEAKVSTVLKLKQGCSHLPNNRPSNRFLFPWCCSHLTLSECTEKINVTVRVNQALLRTSKSSCVNARGTARHAASPLRGGVATLARVVPTLAGDTYPWLGGTYLGWGVPTLAGGYLPWLGVPTLAGGYLPWLGGTYLDRRYLPWLGVPTLAGGTHLWGVPALAGGTYFCWGVPTLARVVPTVDWGTNLDRGDTYWTWLGYPSCPGGDRQMRVKTVPPFHETQDIYYMVLGSLHTWD